MQYVCSIRHNCRVAIPIYTAAEIIFFVVSATVCRIEQPESFYECSANKQTEADSGRNNRVSRKVVLYVLPTTVTDVLKFLFITHVLQWNCTDRGGIASRTACAVSFVCIQAADHLLHGTLRKLGIGVEEEYVIL